MRNPFCDLTRFERALYVVSLILVTGSFLLSFPRDYLSWIASLIGVTALIFVAKGYVIGQILVVVFSTFYAILWRGDHLPVHDCAHCHCKRRFVVPASLSGNQRSGDSPADTAAMGSDDRARDRGDGGVLFHPESIGNGQTGVQHDFCDHQLFCGLADHAAQSSVCRGIRGQRSGVDCIVGAGGAEGSLLTSHGGLFSGVFPQ